MIEKDVPKYSIEELEEALEYIYPDDPDLDEKDHQIAKLKFVIHHIVEDITDLAMRTSDWGREHLTRVSYNTVEEVHDTLAKFADSFPDGTDQKELDDYAERRGWSEYREYMEAGHVGDCTAHASSCLRCFMEDFYGLKGHVYKSKSHGNRMLILVRDHEKRLDEKRPTVYSIAGKEDPNGRYAKYG